MQIYLLKSTPLARQDAALLGSILDEAATPQASAVTCMCTNEALDLWQVEACYSPKPRLGRIIMLAEQFGFSGDDFSLDLLAPRNWVEESLKGLSPVTAGRFFIHGSHDLPSRTPGVINIRINAGTAFGTGHHATTTGCLLALDWLASTASITNALDIGCGTAVLSIAAARLLKIPVIASDIDGQAVSIAAINAGINHVSPLIRPVTASGVSHRIIRAGAPYDLVFANILARPLIALAPQIAPLVARNGHVVLSGLRTCQAREVSARWTSQGLLIRKRIVMDGWSTLIFSR